MRINELILEQEQLDELSLAGIGRGIGAAANAVGRGVGHVQGAWQGAKAAFNQAKDATANKAARNVAHGGGAQMDKTGATTPAPVAKTPVPTTPAKDSGYAGPGEVGSNDLLARARQGTTQDPNAQQAAPEQPAPTPSPTDAVPTTPTAQPEAPAAEPTAPAAPAAPVGMKADEIVKGLSDVWGKARASQDSKTSAPAVQQQIKQMGKEAGMAGQTIAEGKRVGFRSNFLGMEI
jgi:hypothetical protein